MTQTSNPLQQFFRQPALYIRLPSEGRQWPPGSINMPPNQEIPVLPMNAIDEITYRTPDALFNGSATVNVIQSCIPSIVNAWVMPQIDLNTVLTAIRIASFGRKMDLNVTCPACNEEAEFELDLQNVLNQLQGPDYTQSLRMGDLEIYFRSMTYKEQTDINLMQFEQQRILSQIPESDLSEDQKTQRLNEAVIAITRITLQAVQRSIASIRTPTALVSEGEHILEFLEQCDRNIYSAIREKAVSLRGMDDFKPVEVSCPSCAHHYEQKFSLDSASFFDNAS